VKEKEEIGHPPGQYAAVDRSGVRHTYACGLCAPLAVPEVEVAVEATVEEGTTIPGTDTRAERELRIVLVLKLGGIQALVRDAMFFLLGVLFRSFRKT
jgi:hypothetical protein